DLLWATGEVPPAERHRVGRYKRSSMEPRNSLLRRPAIFSFARAWRLRAILVISAAVNPQRFRTRRFLGTPLRSVPSFRCSLSISDCTRRACLNRSAIWGGFSTAGMWQTIAEKCLEQTHAKQDSKKRRAPSFPKAPFIFLMAISRILSGQFLGRDDHLSLPNFSKSPTNFHSP